MAAQRLKCFAIGTLTPEDARMDPHVLMHMRDVFQERLGSHVSHCVFGTVNVAGLKLKTTKTPDPQTAQSGLDLFKFGFRITSCVDSSRNTSCVDSSVSF